MLAQSGLFEIVEAIVAQIVSPELGAAYLGTQGDEWDAQKDMLAALSGALLCMAIALITERLNWSAGFRSKGEKGRSA
jgi:putative membrane protein